MEKTNAQRFIHAYNTIDQTLRYMYNYKRSMSFSDIVRRSVPINYLVRKYEDKLVDYGRLRNAIIHKSSDEFIIAEPHGDVVLDIEKIAEMISTPPKVLDVVEPRKVVTALNTTKVCEIIKLMTQTQFSNIPIYKDEILIGCASGKYIVEGLGNCIAQKQNVNDFIKNVEIEQIMEQNHPTYSYFEIAKSSISIEEALQMFYRNRKLTALILTKNGTAKEDPINIITTSDLIELNNHLID